VLRANRIPPTNCPHCLKAMNRAGGTDPDSAPIQGAFVVCRMCSEISVMNDDLSLRKLTADELDEVRNNGELQRQIEQFRGFILWLKKMEAHNKN
jgi:hypothetical protein